MNNTFDQTLPCLQCVGPWWSENDRRILFCHLNKMFSFNDGYLATLPAAKYKVGDEDLCLSNSDINNEYARFSKDNEGKRSTCNKIRNFKFSFGKINPHICYLCPFSKTYKNYNQSHEYRLIYYFLNDINLDFKAYISKNNTTVDTLFDSYYPAYIDKVLVDAFPFSMIAQFVLDKESNAYLSAPSDFKNELNDMCKKIIIEQVRYVRLKDKYEVNGLSYKDEIIKAGANAFDMLLNSNAKTRLDIDDRMVVRLFNIVKDRKSYIPKAKSEYHTLLKGKSTNLFQTNIDNYISALQQKQSTEDLLSKELTSLEDDSFKSNPELDKFVANINCISPEKITTTLPLSIISNYEHNLLTEKFKEMNEDNNFKYNKEDYTFYKSYYSIISSDDIYVYGSDAIENDSNILKAFIQDAAYISIESACLKDIKGILMMNPDGDLIFYSIERYGPKLIRDIADSNILAFTSNIYYLCRYLYKNKVYNFNLKDVGSALSLAKRQITKGINDISVDHFPDCMKHFKELYDKSIGSLSKEDLDHLYRLEKYYSLLCSDGDNTPFDGLPELCSFNDSLHLNYFYNTSFQPLVKGTYIHLKCKKPESIDSNFLHNHFMDICIDLNNHISFTSGTIHILNIGPQEILLYLTGSPYDIQKAQLYLSSSIRRVFNSVSFQEDHIQIEETSNNIFSNLDKKD